MSTGPNEKISEKIAREKRERAAAERAKGKIGAIPRGPTLEEASRAQEEKRQENHDAAEARAAQSKADEEAKTRQRREKLARENEAFRNRGDRGGRI